MEEHRDPIAQLHALLETEGFVPLWWVIQWSCDGEEPVAAAWARSRDLLAVLRFLRWIGTPEARRAASVYSPVRDPAPRRYSERLALVRLRRNRPLPTTSRDTPRSEPAERPWPLDGAGESTPVGRATGERLAGVRVQPAYLEGSMGAVGDFAGLAQTSTTGTASYARASGSTSRTPPSAGGR